MAEVASPDRSEAAHVKKQFEEAGCSMVNHEQLMRLLKRLNPGFTEDEVGQIADGAAAWAFAGRGTICCSALVDWLFGGISPAACNQKPVPALVLGDLGSGKTSVYLFRRAENGNVDVQELTDGGNAELPALASASFEDWSAAFLRAAGEHAKAYPVHIGATQWYRELPVERQAELGLRLWHWGEETMSCGFRLLEVSGLQEATFEASACFYACKAVLDASPGIILSAGTGSMQCTSNGVSESIALDTKSWSKRPVEDIPAYREAARAAIEPLIPLLRPECDVALCISAAWYAVVSAGMAEMKSSPFCVPRAEALARLKDCATNPKTAIRDAVNVWRIVECLELMVHVRQVVFGRYWKIDGRDFKTTWSAGYFMEGCPGPS